MQSIGVVGLGRLGEGIAASLVSAGFDVVGHDVSQQRMTESAAFVRQACQEIAAHCESRAGDVAVSLSFRAVDSLDAFDDCDFVIESITEQRQKKSLVLQRLEEVVRSDVPLASNTSAIPISSIQQELRRPERVVGMHFAEPVHATRFLEIIPGERSSESVVDAAATLGRAMGKEPCLLRKDVPGFIVNRLGYALYREALHLIESGVADAETIDRSFRNSMGLWSTVCGPFQWMDISGGPRLYAQTMQGVLPDLSASTDVSAAFQQLLARQETGADASDSDYCYDADEVDRMSSIYAEHVWNVKRLVEHYESSR